MKLTPQQLDAWRVVPRLLVLMYGVLVWQICTWFMALPDPSGAQSTFVSAVVGGAAAWFGFYVNSGRKQE
ncbi:hypothetical protein [Marinobacter sp. NFXS9]|uniref:hypothetical protein n=1 Tax=Marinobacter sp. NFXS9 TaxID=2818433 RepID=UPI0032DFB379